MEKRVRMVLVATALVLTGVLLWSLAARPPEAVPVQLCAAQSQNIYNSISVSGTVRARQSTAIAPAQAGVVREAFVRVGDAVQQGQALFTYAQARPQSAGETVAGLQQAVSVMAAGQDSEAVTVGEDGVVRAPRDGVVMNLPAAGQQIYGGVACARVADLSQLEVLAEVPELYADSVSAGQQANVTASAAGGRSFGARVESVAPVAARAVSLTGGGAATVSVVLPLQGAAEGLRPGYSVTVKVFTDFRENAVVVPYDAVFQEGAQEYVYVADGGTVHRQAVTTGYLLENVTEVVEGLAAGSLVVLNPSAALTDGARVEVTA